MTYSLIRFTVQDYNQWRAVFDEVAYLRQQYGGQGGHVFYNPQNPNEVTVLLAWESAEQAAAYASSDDLRQAQQRAGVTSRPEVYILEGEPIAV